MSNRLTMASTRRLLEDAWPNPAPPSQIPVTDEAAAEKAEERAWQAADDAWSRDLDRRATVALCGYAMAWAVGLWAIGAVVTRLPGGWRGAGAVGMVLGAAWVVRRVVER